MDQVGTFGDVLCGAIPNAKKYEKGLLTTSLNVENQTLLLGF